MVKTTSRRNRCLALVLISILALSPFLSPNTMSHHHHHANMMMSSKNMTSSVTNSTGHGAMTMPGTMEHGSGMNMGGMHMYFHFGYENVPILFKGITVNSAGGMAGACIVIAVMAILYEGLKVYREILLKEQLVRGKYSSHTAMSSSSNGTVIVETAPRDRRTKMVSVPHLVQTLLHLIQVAMSYSLMLVFMTYNAYLAVSIVLGATAGYFLFGWRKAMIVDVNEHCH